MKAQVITLMFLIATCACNNNSTSKSGNSENNDDPEQAVHNGYRDGDYCAEIEYYYSKTRTNSTYTLKVEIENNRLVKIFWPNGGWLDDSHFMSPDISDGTAIFESDRGGKYQIKIIGDDDNCRYSKSVQDVEEVDERKENEFDGVTGVIVWESSSCDYVVIYTENSWYVVAQNFSGRYSLSKGDKVKGDLVGFGFEDVYCINKKSEMRLYIDNYYATQSYARDLIIEKCDLKEE